MSEGEAPASVAGRIRRRWGCGVLVIAALLLSTPMTGLLFPFQGAALIVGGWIPYLMRVVPEVTVNAQGLAIGALSLAGMILLGHHTAAWLYAHWGGPPASGEERVWQPRWTAGATAVIVLTFVATIATIGIVHQTVWLLRGPLLTSDFSVGKVKVTMSDMRAVGTAIESYRSDHQHLPRIPSGPVSLLAPALAPSYIRVLPTRDAWRMPYMWHHDLTGEAYTITSHGRDRRPDGRIVPGAHTSFDADIYYSDDKFIVFPEGTQP